MKHLLRHGRRNVIATALVDAGPIVALVDRDDAWHAACREAFSQLRPPLLTSVAVLTEALYLAGRAGRGVEAAWTIIKSGAITLAPIANTDLRELHFLMSRYADRPMDFTDATLVLLARRHNLTTIFTIDHDDFETYRIDGTKKFRIVPGRRP